MIAQSDLAAMVRRAEAATAEPWTDAEPWYETNEGGFAAHGPHHPPDAGGEGDNDEPGSVAHQRACDDQVFVNASRTDVPILAAALSEAMAALTHAIHRTHDYSDGCSGCTDGEALLAAFYGEGK